MQAQLANQQQGMTAQQLAEQSRQFGAGQDMTAAQQRAQFGQSAQQLFEQSRQFGAGLGLQGLQTAMTGAGQLGALGGQQFGQQRDILGLQNQFGTQQQQLEQARINANMQNYAAEERYPYQNLEFMSNILRGTPMGTVQSMYQQQPGIGQQLLGTGLSAASVYNTFAGGRSWKLNPTASSPRSRSPRTMAATSRRSRKRCRWASLTPLLVRWRVCLLTGCAPLRRPRLLRNSP
jgi:hypothetical protein